MSNWGESPNRAPPQPTRLPNEIQDRIFLELMDADTARQFVDRYPERLVSKQFFGLLLPYLGSLYIFLQYQPDLVFDYFYDHQTNITGHQWTMLVDDCKLETQTYFRKTYRCYPTLPGKLLPLVKNLNWYDSITDAPTVCFDPQNRAPNHVVQYFLYQFYLARGPIPSKYYIDIPFLFTFLTRAEALPDDFGSLVKLRQREWFLVLSGRRKEVNWPFWSYIRHYYTTTFWSPAIFSTVEEVKKAIAKQQMELDIHDIAVSELRRHGVSPELLYTYEGHYDPEEVLRQGVDEGNMTTDEGRADTAAEMAGMVARLAELEEEAEQASKFTRW